MNQIDQLRNNLRQVRQNINSVVNQVNQQLSASDQIVQNIGTQLHQTSNVGYNTQFGTTPFGGSQYQPSFQNNVNNPAGNAGFSQYTANAENQYGSGSTGYQSSMQRGGGVNQFGAQYSSGIRDDNISPSYYQAQGNQLGNTTTRNQYNPGMVTAGAEQYGAAKNQASMLRGGGVNQYGAKYSSGIQDEEVGQSYYAAQGNQMSNSSASANQLNNMNSSQLGNANTNSMGSMSTGMSSGSQYNPGMVTSGQLSSSVGSNQYSGATYSSGIKDKDVAQSYYQSKGNQMS